MPEWTQWIPETALYAAAFAALAALAVAFVVALRRYRLRGARIGPEDRFPTAGRRPLVSPADPASGRPVVLPPPPARFAAREEEEAAAASALENGAAVVIHGPSGVGKTALAARVAHRLLNEGRFSDGAVHADLRGGNAAAAPVLRRLLQQIGVIVGAPAEDAGPQDETAGLAALWKRETTGKDLLVLLDDAPAGPAIAAFLPGEGASTLATSLSVPDLRDALVVPLQPLPRPAARGLVRSVAPSLPHMTVERIVSASSGAPLILAAAAEVETAEGGGGRSLRDLEAQEGESMRALTRRRMAWAIDRAPADLAAAWSALSLWREGVFTDAAASAWGVSRHEADRWLRDLAARRLLRPDPVAPPFEAALGARWILPPRLFAAAADRLEAEPRGWSAKIGWMRAECAMLESAERLHAAGGAGVGQGLALLDLELAAICDAAEMAGAAAETDNAAAEMAMRFAGQSMLSLRLPAETLRRWIGAGLAGARRFGDAAAENRLARRLSELSPERAAPEVFEILEERPKSGLKEKRSLLADAPQTAPQIPTPAAPQPAVG